MSNKVSLPCTIKLKDSFSIGFKWSALHKTWKASSDAQLSSEVMVAHVNHRKYIHGKFIKRESSMYLCSPPWHMRLIGKYLFTVMMSSFAKLFNILILSTNAFNTKDHLYLEKCFITFVYMVHQLFSKRC